MKIDITRKPPADLFKNHGRYRLGAALFLAPSLCGLLLIAWIILSDSPPSDTLEMVAFGLFVVPVLGFSFFGGKLQAYKGLNPAEIKELAALMEKHPEVREYCAKVTETGRQPIMAEFEACREWAEDVDFKAEKNIL
ncbi:MAG: hypothetical protein KKG47_02335 [Proteobacteria bacterium]|nr:hypothetical protein [Pseudomonadota bacterium]MBU1737417.1 hypothetical protein [Pseudomonadota bacterium]